MSTLIVSSLSKSFGDIDIFAGVSFSLPQRGRYAIVGPNGVGKTTLLRIIAGEDTATSGNVQIARGTSMGYLHQEAAVEAEHTLREECLRAFGNLREMEAELKTLEKNLHDEEALERYGTLQARFEHAGGYTYELEIQKVLTGLGFTEQEQHLPLPKLSGGQRTRAVLARLLLTRPDLLLLDEPTNHLDINAVEWLENYLRDWPGATLIVSHDRYFIDRVATHVLEMFRGFMEIYRGNYSIYVQEREIRWNERIDYFNTEKARLLNELDYIKRNIAGQNVAQAKGKLRRLSRQIIAIEKLGFEGVKGKNWSEITNETAILGNVMGVAEVESRIKALKPPITQLHKLSLQLRSRTRSGKIVLRTRGLKVGYPGNPLFTVDDIEFHRLGIAAIIGPNGAGKSTLLKTILEQHPPLEGKVRLGASLDVAYFAQAHEDLLPENSLIDEINRIVPHMLPADARKYLARFLFTGDDVFKTVGMLSGGERGRLALAKLALTDANLLLLDEPTNHLDIPSQEILQDVIREFNGTVLMVSHDRFLIDALATEVWEIDPGQKRMHVFKGTYSEYRDDKTLQLTEDSEKAGFSVTKVEKDRTRRKKNKEQIEARRRRKRLEEVESLITMLEDQLETLSTELTNPPDDPQKVHAMGERYVDLETSLNSLMEEWETLHD